MASILSGRCVIVLRALAFQVAVLQVIRCINRSVRAEVLVCIVGNAFKYVQKINHFTVQYNSHGFPRT